MAVFAGYLLLRRYSTAGQNPVLASVLAVFGAVDVVKLLKETRTDVVVKNGVRVK